MKRSLAFLLLLLPSSVALAWPPAPVGAASSVEAGWWSSAPVAPLDVPTGGLAVQGGPDPNSPIAFSAVSFALATGESPQSVTLAVNGSSATTPNATLKVCPLTSTFTPASGASMNDAPKYSCETSAAASPSTDGKSYTFDVASFGPQGALAVAILPTQPTDRVVFDAPSTSSLTSTTAPASTTGSSPAADTGSSPPAYQSVPANSGGSFEVPSAPLLDVPGPASGSVGLETPRAAATNGATQAAAGEPATSSSHNRSRVLVPLALGMAIVAAALWLSAGAGAGDLAEEA